MVIDTELEAAVPAAEEFLSEGLITEVLAPLKSGKEATTYLCRAAPGLGPEYAVLKVYHERSHRNFVNDAVYQEGRVILNGQVRRATAKKTEFGREAQSAMWVDHEYEMLNTLLDAGADVPEPFASNDQALLMAFVGDGTTAAPQLQHARLSRQAAAGVLDRLIWNVRAWLGVHVIHADLSAFNILWDGRRPVIIDFPQAVDARFSPSARSLLERDLANAGRYFSRYGLELDAARETARLWNWWKLGAH